MMSRDPERSRSSPLYKIGVHYLESGWRYRLGSNGAPIGNSYLGIKWSRDRLRHVTVIGQGRDPYIFGAHYLDDGWRYGLVGNG